MPATLVVEAPVVVPVLAEKLYRQCRSGEQGGVGIGAHDFEFGRRALARVVADEHRS